MSQCDRNWWVDGLKHLSVAPSWHSAMGWGQSFCTWKEKEGAEATPVDWCCHLDSPNIWDIPWGIPQLFWKTCSKLLDSKESCASQRFAFFGVRFLNPYSKLIKPYPAQYAQSTSRIAHVGVHQHPLSLQLFLGPDGIDPGAYVRFTSVNVWRC